MAIAWIIIDILLELVVLPLIFTAVCSAVIWLLFIAVEKTKKSMERALDALEPTARASEARIGFWMPIILFVMGALTGWMISLIFPKQIFDSYPISGLSLLFTPILVGSVVCLWGSWREEKGYAATLISSFKGGALFGFAAAGTRLILVIM